GAVVGG
nr:Chain A, Major prion protein [Homo sapiens]